jgi:UDP-N-acetylglucosamine pyrophosphorylase
MQNEDDDALYKEILPYYEKFTKQVKLPDTGIIKPFWGSIRVPQASRATKYTWVNTGLKLIRQRAVAVVMFAGGQGTRLGHDGPKGCFEITPGLSIFALHAREIMRQQRRSPGGLIRWYVMTSEHNHDQTVAFFRTKRFLGLRESQVVFFQQTSRPCLSPEGGLLYKTDGSGLVRAPGGNGGVFAAIGGSGALDDMRGNGVKFIQLCGVDNILTKLGDPLHFGLLATSKMPFVNKTVPKTDPVEPVGVMALRCGTACVVEYSELTAEQQNRKTDGDAGELVFGLANIAQHFCTLAFLARTATGPPLHWHMATKRIPHAGDPHPSAPNALKAEQFVFDAMPSNAVCTQVERSQEFAPVKNKEGAHSPATALALYRSCFPELCRITETGTAST